MIVNKVSEDSYYIKCNVSEFRFLKQFIETSLQMYKQMHDNPVMRKMMASKEKKTGVKGSFQMMLDAGYTILNSFNNPSN